MQRTILAVALGTILGVCMAPAIASADHGHRGHGHGHHGHHHHGHRHHHAHRPSGVYHHYQRARPFHYDLYWHGDHYDAVPHSGAHHYDYYRPHYGHSYGYGYSGGGVYLPGVAVRW